MPINPPQNPKAEVGTPLLSENEILRETLENIAALDPLTQGDIAVRLAGRCLRLLHDEREKMADA